MNWLDNVGNLLNQYSNPQGATSQQTEQDFDSVAQAAPRDAMSQGVAEAFRSDQTPPFGQMLGQLFGNSNGLMRAGVLNGLIAAVGPQVLSSILSRHGAPQGLPNAQLSPEEAEQIPPGAVQEIAEEAQKQDPSIVDRMGDFYAEHPTVVKTLGAAALGIALNHLANQKRGTF